MHNIANVLRENHSGNQRPRILRPVEIFFFKNGSKIVIRKKSESIFIEGNSEGYFSQKKSDQEVRSEMKSKF